MHQPEQCVQWQEPHELVYTPLISPTRGSAFIGALTPLTDRVSKGRICPIVDRIEIHRQWTRVGTGLSA
jgi:hypothetical protein